MWPFTSRRVLGNRWWAMAFVVFVCWQAVEMVGAAPAPDNADNTSANASSSDVTGSPFSEDALRNTIDTMKSVQ